MDTFLLAVRVIVSLAVVLGVIWYLQRRLGRGARAASAQRPITVLSRQSVGPKASVALVEVDGRTFVLGVTEHSVNVLHSAGGAVAVALPDAASQRAEESALAAELVRDFQSVSASTVDTGPVLLSRRALSAERNARQKVDPLAGSILSPNTWKQTFGSQRQGR